MSPGRNPHSGFSPSRHGSSRTPALSEYQDGKPYSELTGPDAVSPPGFFTVTWVAAIELVANANETATPVASNRARRARRDLGFRSPESALLVLGSRCWPPVTCCGSCPRGVKLVISYSSRLIPRLPGRSVAMSSSWNGPGTYQTQNWGPLTPNVDGRQLLSRNDGEWVRCVTC